MLWRVEYTDEFGVWWEGLSAAEQESVAASVGLLERLGPDLPFPHSSGVVGSRHGHMRELRVQHRGRPLRVLYAFDPRRVGLLLVGGDKTGDRRWYDVFVPVADRIYGDHIVALKTEHQRMSKSFEELRRKMPPARQSKARARTDTMVADLALAELRRNFGVTQEQLAGLLDIRQAAISKIERRDDVLLVNAHRICARAGRRARDHGAIRRSCASAKAGFRSTPRYQVEIETRSARSVRQRLWDAEQDISFDGRCRASDVIVISHDPFLNPDVVRGLNGH